MVPEARPGQYVLVHVGVALQVVDEEEASACWGYLEKIGAADELQESSAGMPDPGISGSRPRLHGDRL